LGTGATVASRLLTSGANTIPYTIYRDSNRTQLWGATANVDTQAGTGDGSVQTYTAYGRVAPVANPVVGAYADTVSIVVTY
jgi:spore coat protein U-like protein